MSDEGTGGEVCAVCGKPAEGERGFSHLYHGGRRFPLCCPMCLQLFQRAPDRFARGENPKTLVEELLDELKWRDSGR
ncbi:MAG: hypothetical protein HYX71_01980 [Opitutae bacterium]|nr:hypothetical protein [Opitutae bacterium]